MDDKYLKALHVQFEDGKELVGVPAFIYVWNNTTGYKWLAKLISLPIILQLSQFAYAIIARILFWRFKIFN
jgi:predicted DCC family thiol-disulfide oxidoreductase YuxK